jgi:2-polyprenyl-6-methoxyphenol hydroxylase-like FAD-dependent oxidoreductase
VIIVGAGPSGLLLGLRLAQKSIEVTLLELANELDSKPRATHYASAAVEEFAHADVLEEIREKGFSYNGVCWRKPDHTFLARTNTAVVQDDPYKPVTLPLDRLGRILYDRISQCPSATVLWGHEVIGIEQDASTARVTCKTADGEKVFEADYIVGCDGANSKIRRSLFGDWEFPGHTWDQPIVATNVHPCGILI